MTLEQVADKPDVQTVLGRVQRRKQAVGTTVSADEIVAAVGADRR